MIEYPFHINYREVSAAVAKLGHDAVHAALVAQGFKDTVATVIIRTALSRGWGS